MEFTVAGELKVPGFSEYIHPIDENHLLTLGRAATLEGVVEGLQLSIFDISDFSAPKLLTSKNIGVRGSASEATYNHKAFTYHRADSVLAIPVDLYEQTDEQPWGQYVFSGLQLYDIDIHDGISLRGQISTVDDSDYGYPTYYGWTRGMFIENNVYAITEMGIKSAALLDPSKIKNSLVIEGSPHFNEPSYFDDFAVALPLESISQNSLGR